MAAGALGKASSLLLLASIIQGLQHDNVLHYGTVDALEGQDVTLPYSLREEVHISSFEWKKMPDENTKLALLTPGIGSINKRPNITILTEKETMGFLRLTRVSEWDSGVYICDLMTFPLGSIRTFTELKVKGVESLCDLDGTVEVHIGGNVSIHCAALTNARYRWTKGNTVVSVNESLELWQVTESDLGVYILTVNTGSFSVQKSFSIEVQTQTTTPSTDLFTFTQKPNGSVTDLIQTTDSSLTTSPTTILSTISSTSAWTTSDSMPHISNSSDATASYTNDTTVTPTTDLNPFRNSTYQELNQTHSSNTSTPQATDLSPTSSYESTSFNSTLETREESSSGTAGTTGTTGPTGETPTQSSENPPVVKGGEGPEAARSHLLLVFITVLVLILIVVAGILYRRHTIKQRMDLPPPFKPPPPPVKYAAAKRSDIYTPPYPIGRCNSVTELGDMR